MRLDDNRLMQKSDESTVLVSFLFRSVQAKWTRLCYRSAIRGWSYAPPTRQTERMYEGCFLTQ